MNVFVRDLPEIHRLIRDKSFSKVLIKILEHMHRIRISLEPFCLQSVD